MADGSTIQIIQSDNNVNDGFPTFGTNLITDQTLGDDVIVGTVSIDSDHLSSNGTFFSSEFMFDSGTFGFLYLRVFDTTANPVNRVRGVRILQCDRLHESFRPGRS